jgi:hypothetical protein
MHDRRIDALSRKIAAEFSRRRMLGGLAGAALGWLGGAIAQPDARAIFVGSRCKHHGARCPYGSICAGRRKRKRCVCSPGLTQCGRERQARCYDLLTDPANCGACFANTCLLIANSACQSGRCCTRDGGDCARSCGAGASCPACCGGTCRLDGTCGPIVDCLASGAACPSGCVPGEACPGCCERTCNLAGDCAADGCVLYGGTCTESAQCCNDVPCTLNRCRYP